MMWPGLASRLFLLMATVGVSTLTGWSVRDVLDAGSLDCLLSPLLACSTPCILIGRSRIRSLRFNLSETNGALRTRTGQSKIGREELDQELSDGSSASGNAGEDDGERLAGAAKEVEKTANDGVEAKSTDEDGEKDGNNHDDIGVEGGGGFTGGELGAADGHGFGFVVARVEVESYLSKECFCSGRWTYIRMQA
ncbi:hypothetical protein MA16_Dca021991 [Dendrobium catenatum]|uniref:Uncharacterized protein n=1 Tax=Dendrobium catenatum TaxID=906689 RepID=A0A2I0X9U3_9ASPA|nr:hypothetical protein MA16_Dca021991 [Dendrobium catenatum]